MSDPDPPPGTPTATPAHKTNSDSELRASFEEPIYAWSDELRLLGAKRTALGVLDLVFSTPEWIHRRVEHAEIVTAAHFKRHVSLDFTIPVNCQARTRWFGSKEVHLLPVDILAKQPLVGFDLRDESGRPVPTLTRRQNSHIAWRALSGYAEALLSDHGPLPATLDETLGEIARGGTQTSLGALKSLIANVQGDPTVELLINDEGFRISVEMLARNFLLIAALPSAAGSRRILKFTFEESLAPVHRSESLEEPVDAEVGPKPLAGSARSKLWGDHLLESLGLRSTSLHFRTLSFSDCESYHFEATAPEGIEFIDVVLSDVSSQHVSDPPTDEWTLGYNRVLERSPHRAHLATRQDIRQLRASGRVSRARRQGSAAR